MTPSLKPRAAAPAAALGFLLVWFTSSPLSAQVTPPEQAAKVLSAPHLLTSDGGLVLNFIKPDRTADFEAVVAKLKEALKKSPKPERQKQAASWKVYKSPEAGPGGSMVYVFTMEPAVKGVDYTVSAILSEAFPADAIALYKQYSEAYASGYNFLNLSLVQDLGK